MFLFPPTRPQVRKTTSASTASAMVLTAIERMESHHSSSRSSLKFRSPENAKTPGSCGWGRENSVSALRGEQQPVPKSKSAEELSRLSSSDAGAVSRDKDAEVDGESSNICQPAPIKRAEDGGLSGAVTPELVRNTSDDGSGTSRKEDLCCGRVSPGAPDLGEGHLDSPGGTYPREDERREQRAPREDDKMDENGLANDCGSNLTGSTSSTVAKADNPEPQKEHRILIDASPSTTTDDHEERDAEGSCRSTSIGAPKGGCFSRENAVNETDSGSLPGPGVPQTRQNGSRLNPRATPFTFHPGASVSPATSRPTPGREGETRCPNSPISNATPKIVETSPRQIPPSTVCSSTTAVIGIASDEIDTGGGKSYGGGIPPGDEHDLSPPKEPGNRFGNGSEPPPPATCGNSPSMDVGVDMSKTAAGAGSGGGEHVSTSGGASMTVSRGEGSRESKGNHVSDGVSTTLAFLPVREIGTQTCYKVSE